MVLAEPVRAHYLVHVVRELDVAYLRARVDRSDLLPIERVPEFDRSVCCPASAHEKAMLMGRPGEGFDGGCVAFEAVLRRVYFSCVPNEEFVVVSTGGELLFSE